VALCVEFVGCRMPSESNSPIPHTQQARCALSEYGYLTSCERCNNSCRLSSPVSPSQILPGKKTGSTPSNFFRIGGTFPAAAPFCCWRPGASRPRVRVPMVGVGVRERLRAIYCSGEREKQVR